jgi:hypothetical protein
MWRITPHRRKNDTLEIWFEGKYFYRKDVIVTGNNIKMLVLRTPHKTRWRRFLKTITFGFYKIPTTYKCKII